MKFNEMNIIHRYFLGLFVFTQKNQIASSDKLTILFHLSIPIPKYWFEGWNIDKS